MAVLAMLALVAGGYVLVQRDDDSGSDVASEASATTVSEGSATAAPTSADVAPTSAGPGVEGIPTQRAALTGDADECAQMAEGPWQEIPYGTDPLTMIRAGRTPELSTAPDGPVLEEIVEFETLADYDDPSTILDRDAVERAFAEAGFREGVAARHVDLDGAEVSVTALRFRDPAAAAEAMSAHLEDYCGRAVSAARRLQGNGIVVLRDHGSVRTFFVLGDVEISVFVCSCYYPDAERRALGVQWWAEQVEAALLVPEPQTNTP